MYTEGRAAVFSTDFLPYSQTFIYDEVRAHERYSIDVFCKQRLNEDRFPFEAVHRPGSSFGRKVYENIAYWPPFDKILSGKDFHLIHAHFGTGAVYAMPYVKKYDYPLIVTFWGNDVGALIGNQRKKPSRWRYVRAAPRIMARADLMLCVSEELRGHVSEMSGRPEAVKLYHQGVDLSLFEPTNAESEIPRIILIGRFTEKKGHIYALKAFESVLKSGRRAELVLVGSGPLETECRQFVKDRELEHAVRFTGTLSQSETAAELMKSQIALVPSVVAENGDREGSPTVIREAAACGIPVIGTIHAGIPEVINDGETGFLVAEKDVSSLADRMISLLDDDRLRRAFGTAGRVKMENEFDLLKQVAILENHYDSVR